jgi:hypothetical protein
VPLLATSHTAYITAILGPSKRITTAKSKPGEPEPQEQPMFIAQSDSVASDTSPVPPKSSA